MKIELVVFDLAGTTVNDQDGVNGCLRAALESVGARVDPTSVNAVMGIPKRDALRILIGGLGLAAELNPRIEGIHTDFVKRMISFYETDPSVLEIPGTTSTFTALRQAGIRVGVNTGFSRDIVDVLLDRLGWIRKHLIDASVTSDEVTRGRPHPDMIHRLMASVGVTDPKHVAKVGDTPVDLEEGASAGCGMNVGVTGGTHSRQDLEKYPHTHLIETVADFPRILSLGKAGYAACGPV